MTPGVPSVSDYLARMVVEVRSPDQQITARVTNYTQVDVSFRPEAYDRYREDDLAHQLARLGGTAWVAYHRGRSEAYRRSQNLTAEELRAAERPPTDPKQRAYEEELNAVEGVGRSPDGAVRIDARGMTQWTVRIAPGTIRRLAERAFLAGLHAAVEGLFADRQMKIILLKSRYFDLGLPQRWLDIMARLDAANRRR
ncbi:hypothetical protein [Rhizomonospora bruguierae]|uniref:hypothetical protein n=1 Tax=Rhizomonospora bruguierae TaxID=1581705 RepID=UPI001BCDD308|nr:hypothetical protein [Micromonospora sp. NBRC 107566]